MSLYATPCVASIQLNQHLKDYEREMAAEDERLRVHMEQLPAARKALLGSWTVLYAALESVDVTKRMLSALVAGDDAECGRIVRDHLSQHVDLLLEDVAYGINPTSATPDELVREWVAP